MAFSNNLKMLRKKAHLKQQELAECLHVSQQTIAKWENGKSEPNITTLKEIASFFNCSVEDVISSEKSPRLAEMSKIVAKDVQSPVMLNFEKMCSTLDEKTLERIYVILYSLRRLQNNPNIYPKDKQYLFARIAEIIGKIELYTDNFQSISEDEQNIELEKYSKNFINSEVEIIKEIVDTITPISEFQQNQKIVIPFYMQPASAGTGTLLFDDVPAEWITVSRNDISLQADLVIKVIGDSMLPKYSDGDKVYVKKSLSILEGDIGVFVLDGESYIKKMGKGELISLNPDFSNIPLNEYSDCRCVGKVIDIVNE